MLVWTGPDGQRILNGANTQPAACVGQAQPRSGEKAGGWEGGPDGKAPILPAKVFVLQNARPEQSAVPVRSPVSNNNVFPWVFQKASAAF